MLIFNVVKNYSIQIEKIKKLLPIFQRENFVAALSGTKNKVFISRKYVIRFRDKNHKILIREADFVQKLNHPWIPKILWSGKIHGTFAMAENRLPGKTIDLTWRSLPKAHQTNILKQIIQFILYLRTQTKDYCYSVSTGKKYSAFYDYFTDSVDQKIMKIKKFSITKKVLNDILSIIHEPQLKKLFIKNQKITLVHGDLIIHNLLTDGKNITGILDWESAMFGDPDYDLFRLFYYHECAKAYHEQGTDETFEFDYMDKLVLMIKKSDIINDIKLFNEKYRLIRAIFYLNALFWAAGSDSPKKNLNELVGNWYKKSGGK